MSGQIAKLTLLGLQTSVFLLLAGLFLTQSAYAQQAGVSIVPANFDEEISPGESVTIPVTITNLSSTEQIFYVSTRDISDVVNGGVPVFARSSDEKTGMEISGWVSLSTNQITLPGNGNAEFVATMSVPPDATPGSHFGSIVISVDPPEIVNSGAAVGYQVANIIHVRVAGEANNVASIRQFATDNYFNGSQNIDFSVRIENSGNVLVKPTGPLEIYNMLGQKVDTVIFNESQNAVFPGRTRDYNFNWTGDGIGFGRYEAIVSPVYGDSGAKKTMSSSVTFWILPISIVGPALGVLALILLISFVAVKLYIKRTLAHLSGSRVIKMRKSRGSSSTLLLLVVMLTVTALFLILLLALFA